MRLLWNLTGRAAPLAGHVQGLQHADFQLDDGSVALPTKGDLVQLRVSGRGDAAWFKCTGRRFDFASTEGPVLHIDLELG